MAPHILVIDDDQDILLMLQDRLGFLGFEVTTANNGAEGMAILKDTTINGMLLDIQMPVMDGLTMLKHIHERCIYIPIIVMSAELNSKKMIEAIEQGANDYLRKPIAPDLLAKKCQSIFGSMSEAGTRTNLGSTKKEVQLNTEY